MVPGTGWFLRWGRGRRGRCCTVRAPDEYDDDDGDDGDDCDDDDEDDGDDDDGEDDRGPEKKMFLHESWDGSSVVD